MRDKGNDIGNFNGDGDGKGKFNGKGKGNRIRNDTCTTFEKSATD